jgi:hypothetical protein
MALAAAIIGWVTHTLTWVVILVFAPGQTLIFLGEIGIHRQGSRA